MEDVEHRRQRLAAMREEAQAQGEGAGGPPHSATSAGAGGSHDQVLLPSPLDTFEAGDEDEEEYVTEVKKAASGFDFYTDPLASFSASASAAKRRRPAAAPGAAPILQPQPLPQRSNAPSRHSHQGYFSPPFTIPLPSPPTHGAAGHFHHQPGALPQTFNRVNPNPTLNPTLLPPSVWQPVPYEPPGETIARPPPAAFAHHAQNQMYPQPPPSHQFVNQFPRQGHGWHGGAASGGRTGPWRGAPPSGTSRGGLGFPGNEGVTGGSFSSRSGPGTGQSPGRTGRFSAGGFWSGGQENSSNRSVGRGQGRGRSGGRRGGVSAKEQPHLFFKRSMVEDPWQALLMKADGK